MYVCASVLIHITYLIYYVLSVTHITYIHHTYINQIHRHAQYVLPDTDNKI